MIKKLISMIFIVFCLITACALDTDSDKNEQAAKTDTTGAKTMKITITDAGDLILYQGKSFVIYYDKNSWNFTLLGKLEGITKAELKKLLGTGNVTVILENAE